MSGLCGRTIPRGTIWCFCATWCPWRGSSARRYPVPGAEIARQRDGRTSTVVTLLLRALTGGIISMRDTITWRSPLGVLGRIVHVFVLRNHLLRFRETKQAAPSP
jgi:hypothetical protein